MKANMQAFMTRFLRSPTICTIPVPKPEPNELLIKVAYASLNPTDYKHAALALPPSKVLGCDFSGTIIALGQAVSPSSAFSPGDRIAGIIHGCQYSHTGAFAEYLVTDANLCFKVPDSVKLENACTLGVGWVSAMQALHRLYNDDHGPTGKEDTLLIYSAATNTGIHTIQQARLEYPETFIIATASKQHHAKLRDYGANSVFEYNSPSLVPDIRKLGRDIYRAIDCHSEGRSTVITAECMEPLVSETPDKTSPPKAQQRRIIRTLPPAMISGTVPPNVRADEWILSYTALGKPFWFLFKYYPASKQDYEAASTYMKKLTPLLTDGKLQVINHQLMQGGLKDIGKGFEEMKQGKVRGKKLVYEVGGEVGPGGG